MIQVKKASAGSGKTYTLAHTYIDLLKEDLDYRHILAVTFTNKATAEMKERILKYLYQSPKGRKQLSRILHDYSAFSVSTIDKFFQRALKAFAREIGQMADYQIELDRKPLIEEAMDRVLDSLTGDEAYTDILSWIHDNVLSNLEKGQKLSIEKDLHTMGVRLCSETRMDLRKSFGVTDEEFSIKRLTTVRENCRKIIRDFASAVKTEALRSPIFTNKNAENQRLSYCNAVWYKEIKAPIASLIKEAEGTPLMDLLSSGYKNYRTALLVEKQVFSFGLAREFFKQFSDLLAERNVLSIDDSNTLLRRIISGSDAPFIYEKLGVRFEHFLLDEFQDTSNIQWDNFLPLLRESNSAGHSSLIVGDVKQSIYRWRNSDWRLLSEKVQEEFPTATVFSMQDNYRSCRQIINFNNSFFTYAAAELGLSKLYSDVCQNVSNQSEEQPGLVRVSFCKKDDEISQVIESIESAINAGARHSDIAILVRNNAEGSAIAEALIEKGLPVVSDESLKITSSQIVRRLLSLLSCIEDPNDTISEFIAKDANVTIPLSYHSLIDLCEEILRQLKLSFAQDFAGEGCFIQAFMDTLREWTEVNGHNLRFFLEFFKEKERYICSPDKTNSISILTVHKSKGLEFPYLIFPFADKVTIYKETERWCYLQAPSPTFDPAVSGIYSIKLNDTCTQTLFENDYLKEREMQKVDNLNIFYVALTRAKCCLHIIASNPGSSKVKKGRVNDCKNLSHILFNFIGGFSNIEYGQMYDFSRLSREAPKKENTLPTEYCSIDLAGRLVASQDAMDFFAPDGSTGTEASPRRNGMALHAILAKVKSESDLQMAVKEAIVNGLLSRSQAEKAFALLSERINSQKQFFQGGGYNELAIFDSKGNEYRPDRVVVDGEKVSIIDYKFGAEEDKYLKQVRNYMRLYRELGYKQVEGYLWYVFSNQLVRV